MKAEKFALTRTKKDQIIELILGYHYLFPHLLTKQGSKRSSISRKRVNDQLINQLLNNPVYNPPSLKQLATQAIPQKPKKSDDIPPPSIKLTPEILWIISTQLSCRISRLNYWNNYLLTTVKPVLSGHRIKRTLSIKRTVAKVPKFISLISFKWNLY